MYMKIEREREREIAEADLQWMCGSRLVSGDQRNRPAAERVPIPYSEGICYDVIFRFYFLLRLPRHHEFRLVCTFYMIQWFVP